MSCEFLLTASLEGLNKFLDQEKSDYEGSDSDGTRNTLSDFKIALSPTREILVFAKKTWLLICGSKWDSSATDGSKVKYSPSWHGHVNCKPGDEITSVLCLPFLSQGQSNQGCADWTCVVVGFSSGCVRFYTEAMHELGCSILQEEPITNIKCHCPMTAQHGKTSKQESYDLNILYKTVICVVNGSLLSQTLCNRRFQLAKGFHFKNDETNEYLPLDFKKYSFVDQEEVTDAFLLGQTSGSSSNMFDHLVIASVVNGFSSNYKPSPPQSSLIITSGRRPFVGFHYILEGANSALLSDVALAVASKIKSSVAANLPDWLGFGSRKSSNADKPKEVAQEYAEKLHCRFGLCDLWRQGQSVTSSPDGMFSLVSDSLGRVMLIENINGVVRQLFKGYRDAQCGFVLVQEDVKRMKRSKDSGPKPQPRQGLFVVIYTPKKGSIEIFSAQHNRRVTSFKATKHGRLIYIPRNFASSVSTSDGLGQSQVIFLSDEGIKEIFIPFHCALSEDNSQLSRDLHVLKKIKALLKMENHSSNPKSVEEIEKCARELKADEVRLQTIESMVTYKNTTPEAFKAVLKVFLENFKSDDRKEPPSKKITGFAETVYNLLLFHEFLSNLNNEHKPEPPNIEITTDIPSLSEALQLPEKELDILLKFVAQIKEIERCKKQTTKVAFQDKRSTKLGQYLSCFDFESFLNNLEKNEKQEEKKGCQLCYLNLKSSNKDSKYSYLGEVFFKGLSISSLSQWKRHAENCFLNPNDLASCLLSYWCSRSLPNEVSNEIHTFVEILKAVCSLNDLNVVSVEYNTESPWWLRLQTFIGADPNTIRGLFAAVCCRSVTIFIEQERELSMKSSCKKNTSKSEDGSGETSAFANDWETISKDTCQWDILITQLQDVALLNAIISLTFQTEKNPKSLPEVPFDFEYQCLSSLQSKGTGRVSELVAKWMIQFGFDPAVLVNKSDLEFQAVGDESPDEKEKDALVVELNKANEARSGDKNLNLALEYLALLKNRFPYSLTSSSLLGNMCWEYAAYWFKNISEVEYLESALRCLEVIPASRIKYGISYLCWNTHLEQKFESLAKMINALGKVPRDKLCFQELGLRSDQVPVFLKLICEFLKIMIHTDLDDKQDFATNREAVWQNCSSTSASSLVSIAITQPAVNVDRVTFQLQVVHCLLIISGLNVKHTKFLSSLFDAFEMNKNSVSSSHYHNLKLKDSRTEFLQKTITAAVQTIEWVENVPPVSTEGFSDTVPSTTLNVNEFKTWMRFCFDLAGAWAISLDDLRRHQICELYLNGFHRLAEEVITSVNETTVLASQLLVLGGKWLKSLIQDSQDMHKKFANLDANLGDWVETLDLENFRYQYGTFEDIKQMMSYVVKWLPENSTDQKLAIAIVESLGFLQEDHSE